MNDTELNLSKLSYVNKDFRSIYPDLLDLVKTLTNRWDPSSSNESDPGVVLLKVGAFLADHLNYNIDKNILEAFLPSATQEESVRRIAEFGGYTPRYYRSAIGNVSITYNPETFQGQFNVPEFAMVISNDDGSITYTQLDSFSINNKNVPSTCRFIEGTVQRLIVDSDIINLNNLDDFRRIYFPNKYVAENGIFVYNVKEDGTRDTESTWTRTNYIYTKPMGTKCYKLDYDSSKGLPYLEFPSDIANLIGSGLAIYYIYTAGSYGNVKAGELNTIVSINSNAFTTPIGQAAAEDVDNFAVSNNSSIINGMEPETINEIYDSYKKVVGTFDTLVSTQDYSNAIRTAEDESGSKFISNGLVTDRRNDYNNAIDVVSAKTTGTYTTNVAVNFGKITFKGALASAPTDAKVGWVYTNTGSNKTYIYNGTAWEEIDELDYKDLESYLDGMTPYDLIIYALQKYSESDYNAIYYWRALENSFKQITGDVNPFNDYMGIEENLIDAISDNKCINHTFTDLKNGQVYCFKNYVPLNVDIVPFNKVSRFERNEIINNIRKALSDNFNASKVEFGEELSYDLVKQVIEDSDNRINYVRLSDFTYNTKVMVKDAGNPLNAEEYSLFDDYDGTSFIVDLAAKNVLAGRLCLFNFDENFDYKYGQINCEAYTDVVSLKTKMTISNVGTEASGYRYKYDTEPLAENEYVEIFSPNYYSTTTYGSYVLYRLTLNNPTTKVVGAGTEYTLEPNEQLQVYYKDANGNVETKDWDSGTIINSSFDLRDFSADGRSTYTKNGTEYKQIASNESISIREPLETRIITPTYVYWIMNNSSNTLFAEGQRERILEQGEYFIYTDSTKTDLTILGRGTLLRRTSGDDTWDLPQSSLTRITRSQLADDGLTAKIPFINNIDFVANPLTIIETNIITLGKGDSIQFRSTAASIDNVIWKTAETQYANNIVYVANDSTITLPEQSEFYLIRTRYDINLTHDSPMRIAPTEHSGASKSNIVDTVTIIDSNKKEVSINEPGTYLQSSVDINLIGNSSDESIDISVYSDLGVSINMLSYLNGAESGNEYVPTTAFIPNAGYRGWGCTADRSKFEQFTNANPPTTEHINKWLQCTSEPFNRDVQYVYELSAPKIVNIPFSVIWYEYLNDDSYQRDTLNREYICKIFYNFQGEGDGGKVKVRFMNGTAKMDLIHYGHIGYDGTDYYLLPNQAIYIAPEIVKSTTGEIPKNITLVIDAPFVEGGIVTIEDPKVSWGVSSSLGASKNDVVDRITHLLDYSSNNSLQFHWLNEPKLDIAMMSDDLTDPYSLFDHNNVANIITIPEIDLQNSRLDIVKSLRNY